MIAKTFFSKPGSIKTQLTLFYSALTGILILLISLFFYWAMLKILYNADYQFIVDELTIIENIFKKNPDNFKAIKQEVEDIPQALEASFYHYYIRILNNDGDAVLETPNMSKIFFNQDSEKQNSWWKSRDGNQYILKQSTLKLNNKIWKVQIALDVSHQQLVISQYRIYVVFIILLGLILSIFPGYFIAKRGLKSLQNLKESTKKITAQDIQQRIDSKLWPLELQEIAEAFNKMLERIEKSLNHLTQLSDDLAHELRTPINNLLGEAEIALSHSYSIPEYREFIESSTEELNRLYQIIENLLFLAKTDNPQIKLEKSFINAKEEIHLMCQYYQSLADEKELSIFIDGSAEIYANVLMFRRMIGNVLSNAIKYSKPKEAIYCEIIKIDHFVSIIIKDSGIGIAAAHQPFLFQRFYRVDSARSSDPGSTGLGLAIVKSIVDLHQGNVTITSVLNKGTSLSITLPK